MTLNIYGLLNFTSGIGNTLLGTRAYTSYLVDQLDVQAFVMLLLIIFFCIAILFFNLFKKIKWSFYNLNFCVLSTTMLPFSDKKIENLVNWFFSLSRADIEILFCFLLAVVLLLTPVGQRIILETNFWGWLDSLKEKSNREETPPPAVVVPGAPAGGGNKNDKEDKEKEKDKNDKEDKEKEKDKNDKEDEKKKKEIYDVVVFVSLAFTINVVMFMCRLINRIIKEGGK